MDYKSMSKAQLVSLAEELKILNDQLLQEKEQEVNLDYAWTGNLGHWYWNIKTNSVTFNLLKITTLGYTKEDLPENVNYQFFTDKLHPDDHKKTMDAMINHLSGKTSVYEAEYRIQAKDGSYKWYYDRGKISRYNDKGKPLFLAGIVFDITEKKEMQLNLENTNKQLSELSFIDGLTKVANHRFLIEELHKEIDNTLKTLMPLSIAIFDLDYFKLVNDNHGHLVGDAVLVDVAKIIKENIRDIDIVGRYGGEEFLVVFKDTKESQALIVSERIRFAVEGFLFKNDVKVTISGGVYEYKGGTLSDFIKAADINLYEAKKQGRNKII